MTTEIDIVSISLSILLVRLLLLLCSRTRADVCSSWLVLARLSAGLVRLD